MEEKKKVPEIRFQGFTDDWEQRKLGDVAQEFKSGNSLKADEIDITGDYPVYGGNGLRGYTSTYNHDGEYALIGRQGALCGNMNYSAGKAYFTEHAVVVKADENNDTSFLYYMLDTMNLGQYSDQSAQPGLAVNKLVKLGNSFPKKEEQQQIGTYFRSLDHLITLHQRKHEKLVNVKKSMLERLFVQEGFSEPQIRFGDFKAPWQRAKLGEIVTPYADPVETPHDGYERLGIRSHGKGVFHDYVEAGKELDTAQMHRVAAHNLIVNITFAWEHAVAITVDDDEGKLVSHRFPQFAMTERIYDQFLKYLILDARFRHHLLLSSPGGAGRNRVLKVPEMLEYEMMLPDIEEQKQIAGFLNALDELIELYQIKLEKLKNIKKATLQKMFV